MTTHKHARNFFFMIQQFSQRPWFAIRNLRRLHFSHAPEIAKQGIAVLNILCLHHISETDDFFKPGDCISGAI